MKKYLHILLIFITSLTLSGCDLLPFDKSSDEDVGIDTSIDRQELENLYALTGGDSWVNNTNWCTNALLEDWYGVITNSEGAVKELNLSYNNLQSSIPETIGNLSSLEVLNLSNNLLENSIPETIGNLSNLKELNLGNNNLSGDIPESLGNLESLENLDLTNNNLTGEIPQSLVEQGVIIEVDAENESTVFDEDIDDVEDTLERQALIDFYNSTGGENWINNTNWCSAAPLSEWYGVTTNSDGTVTKLDLSGTYSVYNTLTGSIPESIGDLVSLTELTLSCNELSGEIPKSIGNLVDLTALCLNNNELSGSIPESIGNLVNLTELDLSSNELSGSIPESFNNLVNLTSLDLSDNNLLSTALTLDKTTQSVTCDAGSFTINVTSNTDWTTSNAPDWITLNFTSGSGNKTITATYEANVSTLSRTATIKFAGGDIEREITITQAEAAPEPDATLTLDTTTQSVSSSAGSFTVDITSNSDWVISDIDDWITLSTPNGSGSQTITVNYTANNASEERSGSFTISVDGIIQTVTITQSGETITSTSIAYYSATSYPTSTDNWVIEDSEASLESFVGLNEALTAAGLTGREINLSFPNLKKFPSTAFYIDKASITSIASVSAPKATEVGEYAFYGSTSLTTISMDNIEVVGGNAFYGCDVTSISLPMATSIGHRAFRSCSSLTSISLPKATSIGYEAFCWCSTLTYISLPKTISIGSSTFYWCGTLTSISLPEATSIGNGAFVCCDALTSVSLPKVTSIESSAFVGCDVLTSISLPEATSIGSSAFNCCYALTSISLPEVTSIGSRAFGSCRALTSVSFPKATSIGSSAFNCCYALTSISLPEATSIGSSAFHSCSSLTSISLPEVTSIGDCAFETCSSLTSISLPKATSIESFAFHSCYMLLSLEIASNEGVALTWFGTYGKDLFEGVDISYMTLTTSETNASMVSGNYFTAPAYVSSSTYTDQTYGPFNEIVVK